MTTIVCVRRGNRVALGGDGQVSLGNTIIKGTARKVRRLYHNRSSPVSRAAPPTPSPCSTTSRPSWKNTAAS
jgi:hypothetical protein